MHGREFRLGDYLLTPGRGRTLIEFEHMRCLGQEIVSLGKLSIRFPGANTKAIW